MKLERKLKRKMLEFVLLRRYVYLGYMVYFGRVCGNRGMDWGYRILARIEGIKLI